MRCKRNLLVAAVAGLGLALGGCRSSNPCDPCDPCASRRGLFGRVFSRPCRSSPVVVEAGPPVLDEGICSPACPPACPTCPAAPVAFGEGPLLGSPTAAPITVPPPIFTNGNGSTAPPIGPPPRLVPQPQAQPFPYTP